MQQQRCNATTRLGAPCKNRAVDGKRCRIHGTIGKAQRPIIDRMLDFDRNETVGGRVLRLLGAGTPKAIAAEAAGITIRTVQIWEAQGREHDPGEEVADEDLDERDPMTVYVRFSRRARRASAEAASSQFTQIAKAAAGGNAKAAQWLLEHGEHREQIAEPAEPAWGQRRRVPRRLLREDEGATS